MPTTAEYIASWEGYASAAYWDVNHWRLGYGSDTEGPDQINVTQGMTTTKDRALQNLALRVPQYAHTIIRQVGANAWEKQTENGRTALLSLAYNYGSLPASVVRAIMTDDPSNVAAAIRILQGANGGVNRKRRLGEANFYLTGISTAPKQILPPVAKGGIVIGTGALGGSGAAAANGSTGQALVMFAISMISYLVSAITAKPNAPVAGAPDVQIIQPPVALSPLDNLKQKQAAVQRALAEYADAEQAVKALATEINDMLANGPSVKVIEHDPKPGNNAPDILEGVK